MIVTRKKYSTQEGLSSLSINERRASIRLQRTLRPLFVKKNCMQKDNLNSLEFILAMSQKHKNRTMPTMAQLRERNINNKTIIVSKKAHSMKQRRLRSEETTRDIEKENNRFMYDSRYENKKNDVLEDLRKKLKNWRVKTLSKEQAKVISYVKNRKYLKSQPVNRMMKSINKKEKFTLKHNRVKRNKQEMGELEKKLNFFYFNRKFIQRALKTVNKERAEKSKRMEKSIYPIIRFIYMNKLFKIIDTKIDTNYARRLKRKRQNKKLKSFFLKMKNDKESSETDEKKTKMINLLSSTLRIRFTISSQIGYDFSKKIVRLVLINKLRNEKLRNKLDQLNSLFANILFRLKKTYKHKEECHIIMQKRLNFFFTNVKRKINKSKYLSKIFYLLTKALFVLYMNAMCMSRLTNYKPGSLLKNVINDYYDRFYNEIIHVVLSIFPVKRFYSQFSDINRFLTILIEQRV